MKRKVALLMAVIMVMSLLPMNLFGAVTWFSDTQMDITLNTRYFDPTDFARLTSDTAVGSDVYLRIKLEGVKFGIASTGTGTVVPTTAQAINVLGVGVVPVAPIPGYAGGYLLDPAGDSVILDFSGKPIVWGQEITITLNNVVKTGSDVTVDIIEVTSAGVITSIDAPATFADMNVPNVGDTGDMGNSGLTVLPGLVTNPQDERSLTPYKYYVTVNMEQLWTNPGTVNNPPAARLEFILHGRSDKNPVIFTNAFGNGTPVDVTEDAKNGTATAIRVSGEHSQVFRNGLKIDGDELVAMFGTTGSPHSGRLETLPVGGDDTSLHGWLRSFNAAGEPQQIIGLTGTLVFEIDSIVAYSEDPRISIVRRGRFSGTEDEVVPLLTRQLLAFPSMATGVDYTIASVRNFTSGLELAQIKITERRPGSLSAGTHQLRLMAPRDYVWNVGNGLQPINNLRFGVDSVNGGATAVWNSVSDYNVVAQYIDGPTGRPVLILDFTLPARKPFPATEIRGIVTIDGLALVPINDNVPYGDVKIDIGLGTFGGTYSILTGVTWLPLPTNITVDGEQIEATGNEMALILSLPRNGSAPPSRPSNIIPAVKDANGNYTTTSKTAVNGFIRELVWENLRWYPQGGTIGTNTDDPWASRGDAWRNKELLVGRRADALLKLDIAAPPTLLSGQFNWPGTPGVGTTGLETDDFASGKGRSALIKISEVVPGALDTGWVNSILNIALEQTSGVQFTYAAWRINADGAAGTNWMYVPLLDVDQHPSVNQVGVPSLLENSFRLFVPRNVDPSVERTLELYFFMSVVAGYEAEIGEDIDISIGGNAVERLPVADRTGVIAKVIDPIKVTLDGDLVPMSVGQVMSPYEITDIPDIIIEETETGRLKRGTVFTIEIAALPIPIIGNHALVDTVATTNKDDSGLELRTTRIGTGQTAYMQFEVIRESQKGPGTITLSNNRVTGTFLPSIQYGISVNAVPVAANPMPSNIKNNPVAQNTARGLTGIGMFDHVPYFVQVVEFGNFGDEGLPPGVGAPGNELGTVPRTFTENMTMSIDGVDIQTIALLPVAPGYVTTMMSARVFANLYSDNYDWDDAARTFTFSGINRLGEEVVVVLTLDSPNATVNGVPYDIAEYAGQPRFAGLIKPTVVNGRQYVPARFLTNAFGLNITFESGAVTIS